MPPSQEPHHSRLERRQPKDPDTSLRRHNTFTFQRRFPPPGLARPFSLRRAANVIAFWICVARITAAAPCPAFPDKRAGRIHGYLTTGYYGADSFLHTPDGEESLVRGLSTIADASIECGSVWPLAGALCLVGIHATIVILVACPARDSTWERKTLPVWCRPGIERPNNPIWRSYCPCYSCIDYNAPSRVGRRCACQSGQIRKTQRHCNFLKETIELQSPTSPPRRRMPPSPPQPNVRYYRRS